MGDFEDSGGGVPSIFLNPSSKLIPFDFITFVLGIILICHKRKTPARKLIPAGELITGAEGERQHVFA